MGKEVKILKNAIQSNVWCAVLTVAAIILIVASWFVPPMAVIDGSVLAAVGELFGFGALWTVVKAIDKGTPASLTHNGTTISVNKDEEDTRPSEDEEQTDEGL